MTFPWKRPARPLLERSHGRRLCLKGENPKDITAPLLRKKLEMAMPYMKGASLRSLIYEYWRCGQHMESVTVMFRYYP